ncbi:MAG: peptidylprolyl isomerase [Planctomycetes bacterium]|nr:peptidylprolyl isomerase [Planctomycetota bacterium]
MTRTDARGTTPQQKKKWKRGVCYVAGAVVLLGACLVLRHFLGPQSVAAQSPAQAASHQAQPARAVPAQTAAAAARQGEPLKVVATVNGEQVTRQQLADECLLRYGSDVLDSVMNKHLIWEACQARGLKISEQAVDEEITRLAAKFGMSPGRWLTLLHQERNLTPEQYRREVIWPTLALKALAAKEIVVTADELKRAFETEYGPRVNARAITVSSRQRAEQLHAMAVAKPGDFGLLAKEHSEDQSASAQGLIPPIRKHLGDPHLEQIAFGLKEGEVSPVIQVANQYVILRCEKQLPETYIAPQFRQDAENRLRDRVQDQKLRSAAANLFKQLQDAAKVVNVYNDSALRQQMPGVAATINQQRISIQQLAEECVARHGAEVLDGEINRRILLQALKRTGQQVAEKDVDAEIARAADAYGYLKQDGSPDIEAWLKEVLKEDGATVELYVRDAVWPTVALKKLVDSRVQVTEEDIKKGFVSNYGPRVEAMAIVLSNQRQAQKVWEMARDTPTDQGFGELAHQYSVDPMSRENFGKIPPIRRHGGRPELEEEAFALKPGQISGIIASEDKFLVLRCTGHTTPIVQQLDADVRNELEKDIREKKLRLAMTVEFDRLLETAQIENYLAGTFQTAKDPGATGAPAASLPQTADRPTAGPRRQ